MKNAILILAALLCGPAVWAQENTFRLTVLGYQWTTSHKTLTFTWPGSANTSCNGDVSMSGYVSDSGYLSASGTTSNTCSTTYTPPTNQNIDIRKAVVFILADTESSRMVLTCTRNVRWSQCHALNPGTFLARNDHGHFEVQGLSGKGKGEWVKFDIVQQTAISRQQPQKIAALQAQTVASVPAPNAAQHTDIPTVPCPAGTEREITGYGAYCRTLPNVEPSTTSTTPQVQTVASALEARGISTELTVTSTPNGAEIAIDKHFVGNTPSTLMVSAGDHSYIDEV